MKPSAPFLRPAFPFTFIHLAEEFIHTDAQVKENLIVGGGDGRGEAIEGFISLLKGSAMVHW